MHSTAKKPASAVGGPSKQSLLPIADYATSSSILRQALNDTRSSKISIPNIKRVLIVTRPHFNLEDLTLTMAEFLAQRGVEAKIGPGVAMNAELSSKYPNMISHWDPEYCSVHGNDIDVVVTLGGDGTVLYTSSLFQDRVPPIIPFHLGSLGFLTVFKHNTYETVLKDILDGKPQHMNLRMRLQADVYHKNHASDSPQSELGDLVFSRKVLNEVVVDRGVNSTMVNLDLFGDGDHISTVLADGLVIATPTGSTAYNLSAGGPLVHPSKSSVLVTPICPHTLTARPMLLPSSLDLRLSLSHNARSTAWISFDGRDRFELKEGNSVVIRTAVSSPFPSICRESSSKDWFNSLVSSLGWNVRKPQKKNRAPAPKL
ncbi:ATP-NAD kinase-like domain-containing protein [Obelidium mucronatum]|nr:ATP-NAD kinase-like domain-containing protein [Obelidium mucronatum]